MFAKLVRAAKVLPLEPSCFCSTTAFCAGLQLLLSFDRSLQLKPQTCRLVPVGTLHACPCAEHCATKSGREVMSSNMQPCTDRCGLTTDM